MIHGRDEHDVLGDSHRLAQVGPELAPRRVGHDPIDNWGRAPLWEQLKKVTLLVDLKGLQILCERPQRVDEYAGARGRLHDLPRGLKRRDHRASEAGGRHHFVVAAFRHQTTPLSLVELDVGQ
jgi:hypothetical protein